MVDGSRRSVDARPMSAAEPSPPVPTSDAAPRGALGRMLDPLGVDDFFARHWEHDPLHVSREARDRFADLLSVEAIEAALSRGAMRFPDVQLTRAGTPVPAADYTDDAGRVLARRLAHHHARGATIVLSGAHRAFDALAGFVRDLQAELGWRCQANAYLSPPGNRGFAPHHDTHDVFVLQVAGRKTFRFHTGGVDLPFCDERYDPEAAGAREALEAIELGPGDTLYIPRGVAHDALAHADAPSLHVTVGVFPVVLRDAMLEAVRLAAERDVELRRSVPRDAWRRENGPGGAASLGRLAASLGAAAGAALGPDALDEALSRLRDGASVDAVPDAAGLLSAPVDGAAVDPGARLVVDGASRAGLERVGDVVKLRRPGEVLELSGAAAAALEALFADGAAAADRLEGLDPERSAALARRLVELGVCRAEPR